MEAVQHYLDEISFSFNLNAWLQVYTDEALLQAQRLDEERNSGLPVSKLHGVVVGLKDVIAYKDHHLSASSKILEGFTSIYNATVTQRLIDEGAIIIGRNNCDEFAMGSSNENSAFGPVKNAIDQQRVPGGSSGGSAVAVQAGMCMLSLGSDTGGSVRQPADFCGVVGFKPSYGTISRYGLIAYASSFDQIGILATNIEDVKLVLEVIGGPDEFDSTVSEKPLSIVSEYPGDRKYRICYFKNALEHPSLDPQISSAVQGYLQTLHNMGHTVEPIDFELLDYVVPTYYVLTTAEASSNLSRYDGIKYGSRSTENSNDITALYKQTRSNYFGAEVKKRILLGTFVLSAGYFDAYFTKAQQVRKILTEKTKSIFEQYDFIVLPTVPTPAFKIGEKSNDPIEMFLADIYTVYANLAGIPAISLPLFNTDEGLPFGLQVLASQQNDLDLLQFSSILMELNRDKASL